MMIILTNVDSGAVQDVTSLRQAKSARDCLRILRDEKTFTPLHVMVVQYLMKRTECEELEQKCIEYAKEKDVMYFHVNPSGKLRFTYQFLS